MDHLHCYFHSSHSGDVEIKDTSTNKILYLLDDTDVGLIDADDFIGTDFV